MHEASANWIERFSHSADNFIRRLRVIDLGGRDVNGEGRRLWPKNHMYWTVDREPGDSVDAVADVTKPDEVLLALNRAGIEVPFNVVVCTSVFEHERQWPLIIETAHTLLRPGGILLVTTVRDPFPEHSGIDGRAVREGEFYMGVDPWQVVLHATERGFGVLSLDTTAEGDVLYAGRRY